MSESINNLGKLNYDNNKIISTNIVSTTIQDGLKITKKCESKVDGLITNSGSIGNDRSAVYTLEITNTSSLKCKLKTISDIITIKPSNSEYTATENSITLVKFSPSLLNVVLELSSTNKYKLSFSNPDTSYPYMMDISPSQKITIVYELKFNENIPLNSTISNIATLNYDVEPSIGSSAIQEVTPSQSNTISVTLKNLDFLTAVKEAPKYALYGQEYPYTLKFTNNSSQDVIINSIEDNLPLNSTLNDSLTKLDVIKDGAIITSYKLNTDFNIVRTGAPDHTKIEITPLRSKKLIIKPDSTLELILNVTIGIR